MKTPAAYKTTYEPIAPMAFDFVGGATGVWDEVDVRALPAGACDELEAATVRATDAAMDAILPPGKSQALTPWDPEGLQSTTRVVAVPANAAAETHTRATPREPQININPVITDALRIAPEGVLEVVMPLTAGAPPLVATGKMSSHEHSFKTLNPTLAGSVWSLDRDEVNGDTLFTAFDPLAVPYGGAAVFNGGMPFKKASLTAAVEDGSEAKWHLYAWMTMPWPYGDELPQRAYTFEGVPYRFLTEAWAIRQARKRKRR